MAKLLIATQNPGKIEEIHALLNEMKIDLMTPSQVELNLDVKEIGNTYADNAAIKAKIFGDKSGLISLADDSGLEVDVLEGQPGLYSARYSPKPGATDADRRDYLLKKLAAYPQPWTAQFRCVVALYTPVGDLHFAEGICPGEITPEERGDMGFGYDPIFLISHLGKTMAELTMKEKNQLSHRARAIIAIRPILKTIFG